MRDMSQTPTKKMPQKMWGWMSLVLWALLIVGGIVMKRVYGQPDWMVLFHLPAAVFLVFSFRILSHDVRSRYGLVRRRRSS